jgi:site-specific DNA-methyltransferase (adenine-specific)
VLDFFGGSGITCRVAIEEGRHSVGCDIDPDYIKYVEQQVEKVHANGDLLFPVPEHEITTKLTSSHPVFKGENNV